MYGSGPEPGTREVLHGIRFPFYLLTASPTPRLICSAIMTVLVNYFVNLIEPLGFKVGISIEKTPSLDWPVGKSVGNFLD